MDWAAGGAEQSREDITALLRRTVRKTNHAVISRSVVQINVVVLKSPYRFLYLDEYTQWLALNSFKPSIWEHNYTKQLMTCDS